jgi:hypothetical protein
VTSHADAECLDVEPGDATNDVAAAWVKRQIARGVKRPVVYTSLSNAAALLRALAAGGVPRTSVRLWTAHYTKFAHRCDPRCGFGMPTTADATQWTDRAFGRSLDQSLCADDFFGPLPKPKPKPRPADDPLPGPHPLLRRGSTGEPVEVLQRGLNAILPRIGQFRLAQTGRYGWGTQRHVQLFQKRAGLTADGVCGPITWGRLDRALRGQKP